MSRKLKPYKVDDVHFRDRVLPMMLDRDTQVFFIDVAGERVSATTAAECRSKAREAWGRQIELDWRKIIVVNISKTDRTNSKSAEVSFEHRVHEISPAANGIWFERGGWRQTRITTGDPVWDNIDRYGGPTENSPEYGRYVLPWSPALEAACVEIERRLDMLHKDIEDLLGRPDVAGILEAAVGRLLPAAEEVSVKLEEERPRVCTFGAPNCPGESGFGIDSVSVGKLCAAHETIEARRALEKSRQ